MRLTFVVDGALAQTTGGYLYDRIVVDGLRAAGDDVDVVELPARGAVRRFVRALDDAARDERTMIVDELCHPRAAAALPFAKRPGLVTLVHHLAASERTGARAAARLAVERALLTRSIRVIATSASTAAAIAAAGIDPALVRVAPPGRDRLGERSVPPEPAPDGKVRLLFLGTLTPRKGVLTLLEAFGAVADRARLTIAGPADRDPRYAAEVLARAGTARVTGALPDAEIARLLATHDVLVLPSRHEGFGIALAEALAHGLAVVATRAGAIPTVVREGHEALLVAPDDPDALGLALRAVVGNAVLRADMQRAALARARELPTWQDTVRAFRAALST